MSNTHRQTQRERKMMQKLKTQPAIWPEICYPKFSSLTLTFRTKFSFVYLFVNVGRSRPPDVWNINSKVSGFTGQMMMLLNDPNFIFPFFSNARKIKRRRDPREIIFLRKTMRSRVSHQRWSYFNGQPICLAFVRDFIVIVYRGTIKSFAEVYRGNLTTKLVRTLKFDWQ
jgi:hypothetical protein